jgi:hypothetical protein
MSYLKLILNFIKYLIINNPIKLIMVVAVVMSFKFAGTFPGENEYYNIVSQTKDGNTYVYVVNSSSNDSGYEILTSDKPKVVKNGQLQSWNYNDVNILLYVVGGILTIIILVGTIIGLANDDDDIGWEISDCYSMAITTLIYCELEGDTYYYMIMGRLIEKRKDQIRFTSNLAREFRIFNMSDVFRLPKFSTKTQKRNNILDKLGIN